MNMYSVSQANPRFTPAEVEYSFDGNICRCTGYRPIIEAFKSLSVNPSSKINFTCGATDIEESHRCPLKLKGSKANLNPSPPLNPESDKPEVLQLPRQLQLRFPFHGNDDDDGEPMGEQWIKVTTLSTLFDVLHSFSSSGVAYRLVAGNTGMGVYRNDGPFQGFIDINDVAELQHVSVNSSGIQLGGAVTLTAAIQAFNKAAQFEALVYAKEFFDHFRRIAGLSIRNVRKE